MDNTATIVRLPAMTSNSLQAVRAYEEAVLKLPQVDIATEHAFHAGMYARTIVVPAGVTLTGAEMKVPTILIISGDIVITGADGPSRFVGYHVTLGEVGRKQAFVAIEDTHLTMIFPTVETTVEGAEIEFTAEHDKLFSRRFI